MALQKIKIKDPYSDKTKTFIIKSSYKGVAPWKPYPFPKKMFATNKSKKA